MHSPIVSVLMTAYNREKFIAEAIESVISSSYSNFELIIVDDGSKDNTVTIAKNFAEKDNRIRLYINEKNLGDYPNRNKAASYATGKYLKYLDSDDTMSSDCLDVMVSGMEANPECAFGICSRNQLETSIHKPEESFRIHFFERGILDLSPSMAIIRKDVFEREDGFLELRCVGDFEFWMRLALEYPMIEFKRELIHWRQHEQQEILLGKDEYIKHSLRIIEEKLKLSKLTKKEINCILDKIRKSTMRFLVKNIFRLGILKTLELKRLNSLRLKDFF